MENAVEALKLAFAVILLTLALSLSINFFSKARATSETVIHASDETAYYDVDLESRYELPTDTSGNRIVGLETIIPTVYKYDKERYKVVFQRGTYDAGTGKITNQRPLMIYKTKSKRENWSKSYINDFCGASHDKHNASWDSICSFDIVEEMQRNEPWVGSPEEIRKNLHAIFSGGTYVMPQYINDGRPEHQMNYSGNQLYRSKNKKFVEQVGEIVVDKDSNDNRINGSLQIIDRGNYGDDRITVKGNNTTTKRIITYTLIN